MPNSLTWCDLPEDVSLWPGLPLSLSGDEVMPLDYHAGRSGWLLYGRGLDKRRLTAWQRELGAALVIVASWVVEDYQVIRLAGSLTPRATRLAHEAGLDVAPLGKIPHLRTPGLLVMDMDSTAIQIECIDEIAKLAGTGELVSEVTERAMRGELDFTASLRQRVATLKDADASILLQVRDALPLMPGLAQLVLKLETLGWKVAIASGGFTFFASICATNCISTRYSPMSWRSATASSPATCSAISSMRNIKPIRCASWRKSMRSQRRKPWLSAMAPTTCR